MDDNKRDVEDYRKDLQEIKNMIDQSEDNGIVEVWVFWAYGLLIGAASVISYLAITAGDVNRSDVFFAVWLPVIFAAIFFEIIGWVRKMNKKSIPLFSRKYIKLFSGLSGQVVIISIMLYFLIQSDIPHAGIYMMVGAVPLFFYSQITFPSIIIEAWALTGGGILFLLNGVSSIRGSLFAGLSIAVVYFILGFHMKYEEKKSNE